MGNGSLFCTPVPMNMCDITFQVLRLSTFVFNKCSEKKYSRLYLWLGYYRVLVGIMLAQRRRRLPSITSALGQCIVLSGVFVARMESVTRIMQQLENKYNHPMLFQCRTSVEDCGSTLKQHWVNATCLRKVYSRPSDGLVLGQCRR